MQQYLTLDEAAKYLQMTSDELREMAKKKTVRAFQDRGTWRFRSQDIEELARARGLSSDVELQMGESSKPSGDPKKTKKPADSDILAADFSLDDSEDVPLGREKPSGGSRSGKSGSKSPKPGSDSDVRLVMDGDLDFNDDAGKSSARKKKKPTGESGVRLVPPGGDGADSDVRLEADSGARKGGSKSPSDSDIRLDEAKPKKKGEIGQVTEEIDLDAEASHLRERPQKKPSKPTQMAGKSGLPSESPFEISEPELNLGSKGSKPGAKKKKQEVDSSSDFELIPFDSSKSPVELGSGKMPLLEGDEEVNLGSEVSGPNAGQSGINLNDPGDSGISLEDGGSDEIEFELRMDEAGSTPKPTAKSATRKPAVPEKPKKTEKPKTASKSKAPPPKEDDSSSEFELSLEDSSPMDNSSSEFELSLEDESSPTADSSSEFELSLDDSSEDGPKLKDESASDSEFELTLDEEGALGVEEDAGDIFEETNFDVPALEDESGSEAVAIDESDTDLEGSDFEISLDDDASSGDESGSQVVALEDEEEADEGAATIAKPRKSLSKSKAGKKAPVIDEDEVDLDDDEPAPRAKAKPRRAAAVVDDDDDLDDDSEPALSAAAPATEWGALPAVVLLPTVMVMFLVGIMGYETVRGMFGYHRPSVVGKPVIDYIARQVGDVPK